MIRNFNMTYVWWNENGDIQYSPEFRSTRDLNEWMGRNHERIEEQERKYREKVNKEREKKAENTEDAEKADGPNTESKSSENAKTP